jgi:phosphoglycolate phosphatase-like HAD superfamily hydrolase
VEFLRRIGASPEVHARGIRVEVPESLLDWLRREPSPSNLTLEQEVQRTDDPSLRKTLAWSQAIDVAVEQMVHGVPPFPGVRESLQKLKSRADILVVSVAPGEVLVREWEEHDLARHVTAICGQDAGAKADLLGVAGNYPPNHAMMIGDSPGDYRAASANKALFYPIIPGGEEASWRRFYEEGMDRFLAGAFAGEYQASLLAEFDRSLPEAAGV